MQHVLLLAHAEAGSDGLLTFTEARQRASGAASDSLQGTELRPTQ